MARIIAEAGCMTLSTSLRPRSHSATAVALRICRSSLTLMVRRPAAPDTVIGASKLPHRLKCVLELSQVFSLQTVGPQHGVRVADNVFVAAWTEYRSHGQTPQNRTRPPGVIQNYDAVLAMGASAIAGMSCTPWFVNQGSRNRPLWCWCGSGRQCRARSADHSRWSRSPNP